LSDFIEHQLRDPAVAMVGSDSIGKITVIDPECGHRFSIHFEDKKIRTIKPQATIEPIYVIIPSNGIFAFEHPAGRFVITPFEQQPNVLFRSWPYVMVSHPEEPPQPSLE
jgi:hypothetical protein